MRRVLCACLAVATIFANVLPLAASPGTNPMPVPGSFDFPTYSLLSGLPIEPSLRSQSDEIWAVVLEASPARYQDGSVAWIAQPGEWYRVVNLDATGRWALGYLDGGDPANMVWIATDSRLQLIFVDQPAPIASEPTTSEPPVIAPVVIDSPPSAPAPAAPLAPAAVPPTATPRPTPTPQPAPEPPGPTAVPAPPTPEPTALPANIPEACTDRVMTVPSRIDPGREVQFRATGFKPGSMVYIDIIGITASPWVPTFVYAEGDCEARGFVRIGANDRPGRFSVRARGEGYQGGQISVQAVFEIVAPPR
jgi:hypothetical protein